MLFVQTTLVIQLNIPCSTLYILYSYTHIRIGPGVSIICSFVHLATENTHNTRCFCGNKKEAGPAEIGPAVRGGCG